MVVVGVEDIVVVVIVVVVMPIINHEIILGKATYMSSYEYTYHVILSTMQSLPLLTHTFCLIKRWWRRWIP